MTKGGPPEALSLGEMTQTAIFQLFLQKESNGWVKICIYIVSDHSQLLIYEEFPGF